MARILLDARKLGDGGIGVYLENLIDGLLELRERDEADIELSLFVSPELLSHIGRQENPLTRWNRVVRYIPEQAGKYSLDEYLRLAKRQRDVIRQHDVFHAPHYTLPYFLDIPAVVTIHDAIHVSHPETLSHRVIGKMLLCSAARRASQIITVSEASAQRLNNCCSVEKGRITVVPNAVRDGVGRVPEEKVQSFVARHGFRPGYFLFVGSDRPHKGFRQLLTAWAALLEEEVGTQLKGQRLIAVGERFNDGTKKLVTKLGLDDQVHFFGDARIEELACLYGGAGAVVVPSHEEGFGLVALEAMACAKSVVCTPIPSLKEVCGDCAWYSANTTAGALKEAMRDMLEHPGRAATKVLAGLTRARRYSRAGSAKQTLEVYESVIAHDNARSFAAAAPVSAQTEPRVAFVHDWLLGMRGGERCLEVMSAMFPDADIYTLFYRPDDLSPQLNRHEIECSKLGELPGVTRYYRHLLPFYPRAARDLSERIAKAHAEQPYDLVVSVSHCAAKNVAPPAGVPHVSYCLTPMRYLWDQYEAYFGRSKLEPVIRRVLDRLRIWDVARSDSVDHFIGISQFISKRISRAYGKESAVIYPPVETSWITPREADDAGEGFLCVNALVPYKNVEYVVEAFNKLGQRLTVVGKGPELTRLKRLAKNNIEFIEYATDAELARLYRRSKALVFAAEEDFGMIPVEIQAAGRPVIALGRGGVLETVNSTAGEETGVFFHELSPQAIVEAVEYFLDHQGDYTVDRCIKQAKRFSTERFVVEFSTYLSTVLGRGENWGASPLEDAVGS